MISPCPQIVNLLCISWVFCSVCQGWDQVLARLHSYLKFRILFQAHYLLTELNSLQLEDRVLHFLSLSQELLSASMGSTHLTWSPPRSTAVCYFPGQRSSFSPFPSLQFPSSTHWVRSGPPRLISFGFTQTQQMGNLKDIWTKALYDTK